ncbi:hypothetical protein T265_05245 [Opisthorchis viverrini]|uniref:Mff-like domain-containing protein n=1 Tax=Opisthorchis viverrini TaxID=6198 RepID=A0A074ZWN9_OPIVI|nr:hypothetical protein T265_05245 [Opisthorchis viverrini]KER27755.1 hypothetical protein T265_05245 [Opisthorchis viverrini]
MRLRAFNVLYLLRSVDIEKFYMSNECSADFVKEISKKMQIPHRISFGAAEPSLPLPNNGPHERSEMKVPERIMISDSPDDWNPTREVNINDLDIYPLINRPSLEPPPATLVLNEVDYPDLERLQLETEQLVSPPVNANRSDSGTQNVRTREVLRIAPQFLASPEQANNSARSLSPTPNDKRLRALEMRVVHLEQDLVRRKQWDQFGLLMVGVYTVDSDSSSYELIINYFWVI